MGYVGVLPLVSAETAHVAACELGGAAPLERLMYLAWRNGARSAVVEDGVTSVGWTEESGLLYDGLGAYLEGGPIRVSFLPLEANDPAVGQYAGSDREIGYAVIRPSPLETIVEALVPASLGSRHHYLTCGKVGGEAPALHFRQQDTFVTACAHAELWMATNALASRFPGSAVIGTGDIYRALEEAELVPPRLPSAGLTTTQLRQVLHRFGYTTVEYDFSQTKDHPGDAETADVAVYRWVESGFPVLLAIETEGEDHALLAVGHTFDPDGWWVAARKDYFPKVAGGQSFLPSALWSPEYVCMDDNYGPYLNLTRGSIRRAYHAMVPIPTGIGLTLLPDEAERIAGGTVSYFLSPSEGSAFDASQSAWAEEFRQAAATKSLVLRPILVPRDQLESHLASRSWLPEPGWVERLDAAKRLPDIRERVVSSFDARPWVWMVEVSTPEFFPNGLKLGEVILDPRVPAGFPDPIRALLACNLPGYSVWRVGAAGVEHALVEDEALPAVFSVAHHGG